MKKAIYILTILVLLTSCKSETQKKLLNNNESSIRTKVIDFESEFNQWFTSQGLKRKMISDTTSVKTLELWAYRNDLEASDSKYYWYPSKDSSYYLITNYDRANKKRISTKYSMNLQLRFLKTETKEVYIGPSLLDILEKRKFDFHWYDSTTLFFYEENEKGI